VRTTRVFLDANILFSAAWRKDSGLLRLWKLKGVKLFTSTYAAQEADRNLENAAQKKRLQKLLHRVTTGARVSNSTALAMRVNLPEKDLPILQAALDAKAHILLTGDIMHFGLYLGTSVDNTKIMLPADFLRETSIT